jgi:hypothetical protein
MCTWGIGCLEGKMTSANTVVLGTIALKIQKSFSYEISKKTNTRKTGSKDVLIFYDA